VFEPTGSRRDAASTIFNLPGYRVIDAVELPDGQRQVVVESTAPPGCPVCGVISVRVHSRRRQMVRDVPVGGGPVRVVLSRVRLSGRARCLRV
jgi:transposase